MVKWLQKFNQALGHRSIFGSTFIILILSGSPIEAGIIQWKLGDGGNDHYYDLVFGVDSVSWTEAELLAESSTHLGLSGHLVTLNSAAEDEFLRTNFESEILLDSSSDSFPNGPFGTFGWIGLSDPNGTGDFEWVTGEPLIYTNWAPGQPSSIGTERFAHIWRRKFGTSDDPLWSWNDFANEPSSRRLTGYFVEFEPAATPVPEPSSAILFALGLIGLAGRYLTMSSTRQTLNRSAAGNPNGKTLT